MRIRNIFIGFVFIITIVACSDVKKKPNSNIPPKYVVSQEPKFNYQGSLSFVAGKRDTINTIDIEIADTDITRELGLMHRKSMKIDRGMLFVFSDEARRSFWMKDTHIPLDIIFVNTNLTIIHIAYNCQPYSLKGIPSFEYAKYVVEVNAGFCREYSVSVGDEILYKRLE